MKQWAFLNQNIPIEINTNLKKLGFSTILVPPLLSLPSALACHADLQFFLHENNFFYNPDLNSSFLKDLPDCLNLIECPEKVKSTYPDDTIYNIANNKNIAFHLEAKTPLAIKKYFKTVNIPLINVKQGYTRCSTLFLGSQKLITSDEGIFQNALRHGLKPLKISPGFISLPGYKYGFIGGCGGFYNNTVYLTGNLELHPDKNRILNYISKDYQLIFLNNSPLLDIGSIFFLNEEKK